MFEGLKKNLINLIEARKVICLNCNSKHTLKIIPDKFTTWRCKCGMQIYYPPNIKRDYGTTVFIPFVENILCKRIKQNNINVDSFEQYKILYQEIQKEFDVLTEIEKSFKHFKKGVNFEKSRQAGHA